MVCDLPQCGGQACSPCKQAGTFCTQTVAEQDVTMTDENQVESHAATIRSHESRIESLELEIKSMRDELRKHVLSRSDTNADPSMTNMMKSLFGADFARDDPKVKSTADADQVTKEIPNLRMRSPPSNETNTLGNLRVDDNKFQNHIFNGISNRGNKLLRDASQKPLDTLPPSKFQPTEPFVGSKPTQKPALIPLPPGDAPLAAMEAQVNPLHNTASLDASRFAINAALSRRHQTKIPAALDPVGYQKPGPLIDFEPEAEIARFPTIFQFEESDPRVAMASFANGTKPLGRANTVNGPNPAARLLKPFDPAAEGIRVAAKQGQPLRRSMTTRQEAIPAQTNHALPIRSYAPQVEMVPRPDGVSHNFKYPSAVVEPVLPEAESKWSNPLNAPDSSNPSVSRSQSFKWPDHSTINSSVARSQSLLNHSQPTNRPTQAGSRRHILTDEFLDRFHQWRSQHDNPPAPNLSANSDFGNPYASKNPYAMLTKAFGPADDINPTEDAASKRIQKCLDVLKEMGYKSQERMSVYAHMANGDTVQAIELAEEDKKAAHQALTEQLNRLPATEAAKVRECLTKLKEMGFRYNHSGEELRRVAYDVKGDLGLAIERLEVPLTEFDRQLQDRMPGSFP